jgi:hypothetical protein
VTHNRPAQRSGETRLDAEEEHNLRERQGNDGEFSILEGERIEQGCKIPTFGDVLDSLSRA